jgi:hypothetical protein
MRVKRGISNLIVATLVFTALALTLPTLLFYTYVSRVANELGAISYLEVEERAKYIDLNATALIDRAGNLYVVAFNRGGRQVSIERVLVLTRCSGEGLVLELPNSRATLVPGAYREYLVAPSQLPCSGASVGGVYIVTSEPRIYSARLYNMTEMEEYLPGSPTQEVLPPQSYMLFPIRQVSEPWNLSKTLERGYFVLATMNNPYYPTKLFYWGASTVISGGMYSSRGTWQRGDLKENVRIRINNVRVRNVVFGYDPRDPSKYAIMVTNDGNISLTVNDSPMTYCSSALATRIRIYGFTSSNPQGVLWVSGDTSRFGSGGTWVREPSQDVADYMFLGGSSKGTIYNGTIYLEGVADRMEVFCLSSSPGNSSYEPYVLFMNIVRKYSTSSLLFNTIDAVWGNSSSQDDGGLLDYSVYPLTLIFRSPELDIDNNNTKAVLVTINYRFFDNSGDDFGQITEDRPIILVGIVDEEGNVVAYRSFNFRELTRYKGIYPPTAQAQSAVAFIPIPTPAATGLKKFYVFISIQDPYLYNENNSKLDDVDVMVFIDSVAVVLYS